MNDKVSTHYTADGGLADKIAGGLRMKGLETGDLSAADLEAVDECHQCEPGADKSTRKRDQTHVLSNSSTLRVAIDPKSLTSDYPYKMYVDDTS